MSDVPDDAPKRSLASTSTTEFQGGTEVAKVRPRPKVTTGKPKRLGKTAGMKLASGTMSTSGTTSASAGNFYSPELSTDFLELPQSLYEQWNYYRFFYRKNPFVGQALDLHTELPLSKVRLNIPKAKNRDIAMQSTEWCERWCRRIGLLHRLLSMVHEWHLIGEVFVWCEDNNPEMPEELMYEDVNIIADGDDGTGEARIERRLKEDQSGAIAWLKKNYKGWTAMRCLPPEQTHMEAFNFTDEKLIELVPDAKTKKIIEAADSGDPRAQRIVESMPTDVVNAVRAGTNIPLNTDPEAGSFVHYLANKKSDYEPRGHSVLERCLQSLVHFDKLRQANASIASRHMTPIRIVYAEDMDAADTDALRDQVDLALQDPDFSIIANFQITWEEMGSDSRLLDLSGEMDLLARELYAGLGVTEGLLTGESAYSGDKLSLEVINTRYMLLREILQDFTEEYLFKPMCKRMGFVELDDDGNEQVIYPRLSFTRLALRDNADTFDSLFNLYQKGSLDIDVILELLNIDPVTTREKLERDFLGPNDSTFNEVTRTLYGEIGRKLVDESNAVEKVAKVLGLKYTPPKEEGGGRV